MSQSERRTPTDLGLREIMHEIPDRKRTIRGSFALDLPCGVEETTLSSPVSPPLSSAQIERHPIFRSPFSFVSIDSCSNAQRHPAPPRSSGARPPATSVVCTVVVRPTVQMAEVDAPSLPGSPHVIQPPFARWTGTERFLHSGTGASRRIRSRYRSSPFQGAKLSIATPERPKEILGIDRRPGAY